MMNLSKDTVADHLCNMGPAFTWIAPEVYKYHHKAKQVQFVYLFSSYVCCSVDKLLKNISKFYGG